MSEIGTAAAAVVKFGLDGGISFWKPSPTLARARGHFCAPQHLSACSSNRPALLAAFTTRTAVGGSCGQGHVTHGFGLEHPPYALSSRSLNEWIIGVTELDCVDQ